jgi:catechol 2,3-dioxygenase-like lactoylglutathione lyase family enzyme
MSLEPRVSIVTLGVRDLARSGSFYEALGWRRSRTAGDGHIAFFALRGIVLGLYGREALAEDVGLALASGLGPDAFCGVTLAQNLGSEAEVDAALAEAERAGALILKPPAKASWGGYSGYFADPDGFPWEIAYNPFFPLAADGAIVLPE